MEEKNLVDACKLGHADMVKIYLQTHQSSQLAQRVAESTFFAGGMSPLCAAARNGHVNVVRLLVSNGIGVSGFDVYEGCRYGSLSGDENMRSRALQCVKAMTGDNAVILLVGWLLATVTRMCGTRVCSLRVVKMMWWDNI